MTFSERWLGRTLRIAAGVICVSVAAGAGDFLDKDDDWFASEEGEKVVTCVLSWQSEHGDWPKNQDTTKKKFSGDRSEIEGTFDNKATTDELRLLARAFGATGSKTCLKALEKGIDHILKAQYRNGGWPQYFPLRTGYHRHITFNDGSMVRLLEFVREVAEGENFGFLDQRRRTAAAAFERGVECILECQIEVDGRPTVWCAQHDEETLEPAMARSYELPSFSGGESAGILRFLMSLEDPSDEVISAVKAGVAWYEEAKIEGIRVIKTDDGDRVVIEDASAPPLWARFYDLETGAPFFCDRDGVKKDELSQIGKERRTGYAWYGNWGESVARDHAKWPHR